MTTIDDKIAKYKLGVALSGGGTRGYAHLGALKALDEKGLIPDIMAGTSAGALAAVFYADGYIPDEIFSLFKEFKMWKFIETSLPKEGFLKMTALSNFLSKHLRAKTFEDLRLPLYVVASDLETGKERIFSEGELIPAVVASCSIPIVFAPVEIEGHYYVDGGVFMNFPVSAIREKCRTLIGVNVSPLTTMKYDKTLKYVVERTMSYTVGANTKSERMMCDYLIESEEFSRYSTFDFKRSDEIYARGYTLASAYLDSCAVKIKHTPAQKRKPKGFLQTLSAIVGPSDK